jgi:hypothetical protein
MQHYNYTQRLQTIWDHAIAEYKSGNRAPENFFDAEMLADLASIGLNAMDVFDPVEDHLSGYEIDFATFLLVTDARRDYFLNKQKGKASTHTLDNSTLPAKDLEARGIVWLPRIMPKALAKLRGELPPETMYGCGGDRAFFKANNIHPAEFLRAVWAYEDEPDKLIDWVVARSPQSMP